MILKLRQKRKHNFQMQYLTRVRDASRSSKENCEVLVNGYHGCMVAACRVGGRKTIPLALRLWSSRAPGFKGENDEVLNIIKSATVWIGRNVKHEILSKPLTQQSPIPFSNSNSQLELSQTLPCIRCIPWFNYPTCPSASNTHRAGNSVRV